MHLWKRLPKSLYSGSKHSKPVTENHELYKEFYETWKTVYDSQLALADNGLTSHMWIAPGAL